MTPQDISVVIPARNEAASIAACIESVRAAGGKQIIVSDAGSDDATAAIATHAGADKVIRSLPGRGIQMNSGAFFADRDLLLFLHADSFLEKSCMQQICDLPDDFVWGAMRQSIDHRGAVYRLIQRGNAARVRWRSMAFGDQAIFVRRAVFKQIGGFAEIPLMEDVDLSRRLRPIAKPHLIDGPVTVDPRRWQRRGVIRQTALNWTIQLAYQLGVTPERLATWYRT